MKNIDEIITLSNKEIYQDIKENNTNKNYLHELIEFGLDINKQKVLDLESGYYNVEFLIDYYIDPRRCKWVNQSELKTYLTFDKSKEKLKKVERIEKINISKGLNVISTEPTLLHLAVKDGDFKLAKELIENGADINSRYDDQQGMTSSALMYTCTETQFYQGMKTVICEVFNKDSYSQEERKLKNDFIYYLIDGGLTIEPTIYYQEHPVLRCFSKYSYIDTNIAKKVLYDTKWYFEDTDNEILNKFRVYFKEAIEELDFDKVKLLKTHPIIN